MAVERRVALTAPLKPDSRRRNKDVTPDECCEMFSNKFGGLMFGFRGLKATSVCGAVQRAASRSGFSWAAVCKQRALWQQRSVCTGMQRTGYLAEPSGWWVG
ncbi:hypothetical protein ILYODFUR_002998 [Ilyodon furcidens]|uniref:Uncharacterized protein n=1 Tax=Ilyodon furcidens TaxID=33524 RepID=A0ABV0UZR6_9TELE